MSDNPSENHPKQQDEPQLPLPDKKLTGKVQTGPLSADYLERKSPPRSTPVSDQKKTELPAKSIETKKTSELNRPKQQTEEAAQPNPTSSHEDDIPLVKQTAVLSRNNPLLRRALSQQNQPNNTTPDVPASLGDKREVILLIRGMVERIVIEENATYKLGRFDMGTSNPHEVDLSPYGAMDRGVSRIHAQLHLEDDQIYITDLGSTNGTYLSGNKLEPHTPSVLRKGDELLVGRLQVQVLFR